MDGNSVGSWKLNGSWMEIRMACKVHGSCTNNNGRVEAMEARKWYNFETRFISLRDEMRKYLKDNHIKYELSGAYSFYHFEIFASQVEVEAVNKWLDENTITCK